MSISGTKGITLGMLALALSSAAAVAQLADPGEPQIDCITSVDGQWAGPWDLTSEINPPGDDQWAEIAHLIVLPPPNDGLVLFLCRRGVYGGNCTFVPAEAFLWSATDPTNVDTITLPQAQGGTDDPFCSGHALTSSGQPIFYGGTNHVLDCQTPPPPPPEMDKPVGHSVAWIFDNVLFDRGISQPAFHRSSVPMLLARWYPTAMQRGDDTTLIVGHHGDPPPPSGLGIDDSAKARERATWNEVMLDLTWQSTMEDFLNYTKPGTDCVTLPAPISLGDYPRCHQLANGLAIVARNRGYVLDLDACLGVAENERFLPLDASVGSIQPQPESNTTVHYVDLGDDDGSGLFVHEWIVSIDGADIEAGCDDEDSVFVESGEAVFMKDPVPGDSWTSLPPLQKGRTEANAVVGLSGEMMVFGGYGHNAAGDVVPRLKPELFRPSFEPDFLFGPAVASTAWEELCPMSNPHTYHSVAGLLRDGRVVVAGGAYCGNVFEDSGAHSVELFSPPALFGGPRPRIDNVLFGGQTHQEVTELPYTLNPTTTFTIEALLQGGIAGEFRVALTRPASVTHAFDNNQRYVVLKVNVATSFMTPPASWTLAVHLPTESQRDAVPPGYYLLTVVNAAGRPASAKWIRMLP